uniref:Tc1-like transposase DDE domain-containing protein n=1 Tax=Trichogramma kaykai TaxID=54128 RepID=A0ABD2WRC4_9HYME
MRFLCKDNDSDVDIAAQLNCSTKTVKRWRIKFDRDREEGIIVYDRRVNNRRPWKIDDESLQALVDHVIDNPFVVIRNLLQKLHQDVHEQTLRIHLKRRTDIKCRRPAVKAEINTAHEIARMNYAYLYQNWTAEQWRKTIFVDEKVFSTSSDGVTERYPDEEFIYIVEDNSGIHRSRVVREWYEANPRLRRLPFPPKSPDLNIIENVFSLMERKRLSCCRHNLQDLHEVVFNAWLDLDNHMDYFIKLAESMP